LTSEYVIKVIATPIPPGGRFGLFFFASSLPETFCYPPLADPPAAALSPVVSLQILVYTILVLAMAGRSAGFYLYGMSRKMVFAVPPFLILPVLKGPPGFRHAPRTEVVLPPPLRSLYASKFRFLFLTPELW